MSATTPHKGRDDPNIVYRKATNWKTGEVRYVQGRQSQMFAENIVRTLHTTTPTKIKFVGAEGVPPEDAADANEVEVSRDAAAGD